MHLVPLAGIFVLPPIGGLLTAVVCYAMSDRRDERAMRHTSAALDFQLSFLVLLSAALAMFVTLHVTGLFVASTTGHQVGPFGHLFIALAVVLFVGDAICCATAAVRAAQGRPARYPAPGVIGRRWTATGS